MRAMASDFHPRFCYDQDMSNLAITDSTFEAEVLKHQGVVVVDFWANWCGPCHAYSPLIEKLAGEWAGKVKVVKLEVDENPKTAEKYNVLSIPTTMIFKNGQIVEQMVGVQPEALLRQLVEQHLAG